MGPKHAIRYNAFCPVCGSAERHREFIKYLNENDIVKPEKLMLEIGPIRGSVQYFKNKGLKYFITGLHSNQIDAQMDARNIGFKDNRFDYVISSYVLSFIRDDVSIMGEMYRVLKKMAYGLLSTEPHNARWTQSTFDLCDAIIPPRYRHVMYVVG